VTSCSKALAAKNAPPDLLEVIKEIKQLFPAPPAPSSDKSEMLAIITAIKGLQQDPLEVMQQAKELFAPAAPSEHGHESQRDEIDRLDKVLGFAQKLAALRVPNAGGRGSWDVGLELARKLGNPLLQTLNNFLILRSQAKGAMQSTPGMFTAAAAPASAIDPYRDQEALRQHARNVSAQAAGTQPAPPAGQAAAPSPNAAQSNAPDGLPPQNEILGLLASHGNLVLSALNAGIPGCDFADNLTQLFGAATHVMIANYGEDVLAQVMLSIPELRMFGESRLRRFAYEFCHFEEILESESDEEDAEDVKKRSKVAAV
jgi:hypothetical protein